MKQPSAFVSSTIYDLEAHRVLAQRVLDALGYDVVLSEQATIGAHSPETPIQSGIAVAGEVDLLISIVGERFGSVVPDLNISVSQAERRQALAANRHVLTFIRADILQRYRASLETPGAAPDDRLFAYIAEIHDERPQTPIIAFADPTQLEERLRAQVTALTKRLYARARNTGASSRATLSNSEQDYAKALFHPAVLDICKGCGANSRFVFRRRQELIDVLIDLGFAHFFGVSDSAGQPGPEGIYFIKAVSNTALDNYMFRHMPLADVDRSYWSSHATTLARELHGRRQFLDKLLGQEAIAVGFCPKSVFKHDDFLVSDRVYERSNDKVRFALFSRAQLGGE